jgi:hypothetical protein
MVTVGIDPHKHVHVAVAVDAAGRPVGKPLTFRNNALQITVLLTWAPAIVGDTPVTWAIGDGRDSPGAWLTAAAVWPRGCLGSCPGWQPLTAGCTRLPAPSPIRSTWSRQPMPLWPCRRWTGTASMMAAEIADLNRRVRDLDAKIRDLASLR